MIEKCDGFHPNGLFHSYLADWTWYKIQTEHPDWIGAKNPHNAQIQKQFNLTVFKDWVPKSDEEIIWDDQINIKYFKYKFNDIMIFKEGLDVFTIRLMYYLKAYVKRFIIIV